VPLPLTTALANEFGVIRVDWNQWSREAVAAADAKNKGWRERFALHNAKYHWSIDEGKIVFDSAGRIVEAKLCFIGSTSEASGTFQWGWADASMPEDVVSQLASVRSFGEENDLPLLTAPEIPGGVAQGKECVAIAARILGSEGVFIDTTGDVALFFALSEFQPQASAVVG
jgi:hypothetical protein